MKFIIVLPIICSLALGFKLIDLKPTETQKTQILTEEIVKLLKDDLIEKLTVIKSDVSSASVNVNEYVDKILPNVNQAILNAGYDPISLPDERIDIVIGHSDLSEGTLSQIATIERYEDAVVTYDSEAKKAYLELIFRWEDLQLLYKYHTKVTIISMTGHVHGDVEHMKVHLKLGFDFATDHISVEALDFNHTGDITIKFTGNKLIDYITNAMSKVLTTIFHNLIISQVKKVAMDPIQDIVNGLNAAIDAALHPTGL